MTKEELIVFLMENMSIRIEHTMAGTTYGETRQLITVSLYLCGDKFDEASA